MSDAPAPGEAPDGPPSRALTLPAFTPVPREKDRSNGWKPEVQVEFIEALAETGSVKAACARVGRADHGVYQLRRHPEAEEFRRAWDAALDIALRRIEDVAMDRALHGVEQPVYSYGKLVGTRTVHNDRLLMFMLRNRAPERFGTGLRQGAGGPNAVDRMELARLKKRWRRQWEEERREEDRREEEDARRSIDEFLEGMRRNRLANQSPRTRALEEAYQESMREDNRTWEAFHDHPLLPGLDWPEARCRQELDAAEEAVWEPLPHTSP